MKYCRYCGEQIYDEAVICVHCGRGVDPVNAQQPAQTSGINIMCLLGFIFSFLICEVGLVLSIIGYSQVKNTDDSKSKTFAKAGIIISSVILGIVALLLFVYIFYLVLIFIIFAGAGRF